MNLISNHYAGATFDNGVRGIFCDCPDMNTMHVSVLVDRGSRCDPIPLKGIAHFAEHAAYLGCGKIKDKHQINKEISIRGINSNAFTNFDNICHWMYGPDEHTEWMVDMLTSMMTDPVLDPNLIEVERSVIHNERRMCDDNKGRIVNQMLFEHVFDGCSARVPIIGLEETINNIKVEDLRKFMSEYTGNNITLVFVGSIGDFDPFADMVWKYVKRFPSEHMTHTPCFSADNLRPLRKVEVRNFNNAVLGVGWKIRGVDPNPESYNDNINDCVEQVVEHLLFSGTQSAMYDMIREQLGLCYSIGGYNYSIHDFGIGLVQADISHDNVQTTLAAIKDIMCDTIKNGFSSKQVECAKSYFKGNTKLISDSPTDVASVIRQSVHDRFDLTLRPGELFKTFDRVNADMVNDFIREYYRLDKMVTCVVTDKEIDI